MVISRSSYKSQDETQKCKKVRAIHKLDEEQVKWTIQQKRNGTMNNVEIANSVGVSARWIRKLWSKYKFARLKDITYLTQMRHPFEGLPGRREHSAVISCHGQSRRMDVRLKIIIEEQSGIHIPHHKIHKILKDEGLVKNQPKKSKQRKWIRYERKFSNSLWHTDDKQLLDGRWFVSFQDDVSRLIVGCGVFNEPTSEHAIKVLERIITKYGKPT